MAVVRTGEKWEEQEKLGICPKCQKVGKRTDEKCECGAEMKEYWQIYEFFAPYIPIVPKVGKKVVIPKIMLFTSDELIERCCNV